MMNLQMLAFGIKDIFPKPEYQIPGLLLLIGLIVFWVIYRRKQM